MPLTSVQLDAWFTNAPPTEAQRVKHAAIDEVYKRVEATIAKQLVNLGKGPRHRLFEVEDHIRDEALEAISRAFRELAEVIDTHAPDSADKTAAFRCLRLSRSATNDLLVGTHAMALLERAGLSTDAAPITEKWALQLIDIVFVELAKARWQAVDAIAAGAT
jgi:hypothetical protein